MANTDKTINFTSSIPELNRKIYESIGTSLINKTLESSRLFQPKLIKNYKVKSNSANAKYGNMMQEIITELQKCNSFWFSIAFVSETGINPLKEVLAEAAKRGVQGRILTSTYLTFNKPKALRELLKLKNIEVRIFENNADGISKGGLHAKGYCFKHGAHTNLIIGSSNLTSYALQINDEWNLKVSSLHEGALVHESEEAFEELWETSSVLSEEWIDNYEVVYAREHVKLLTEKRKYINITPIREIRPNKMQQSALQSLKAFRLQGKKKALVISATGTGKTYLSALNVKEGKPDKLLFIAHREQLLTQAKKSYELILGNDKTTGLLSGTHKDISADYLFSTVQTLSKDDVLRSFAPDTFDWIIIDEAHHASSPTYQKILSYFKPHYLFGMTATPDRTDEADIYSVFDYNIAYEIQLQDALENDLLCPFNYFGISDIDILKEYGVSDKDVDFNKLVSDERIKHIIKNLEYYGYSGARPKGLIFCSTVKEATTLSNKFNTYKNEEGRYFKTVALSGSDSFTVREEAIKKLECDDNNVDFLDYIFTVDIFNEGVDIPSINQIVSYVLQNLLLYLCNNWGVVYENICTEQTL